MQEINKVIVSKKTKSTVILKRNKFYILLLDEIFFLALQVNNNIKTHLDPQCNAVVVRKKIAKKTKLITTKKLNNFFLM